MKQANYHIDAPGVSRACVSFVVQPPVLARRTILSFNKSNKTEIRTLRSVNILPERFENWPGNDKSWL